MLKAGDIVVVTKDSDYYYQTKGRVGEIVLFDDLGHWENDKRFSGIRFEKDFKGHNLNGKVNGQNHYWIETDCLELAKKNNKGAY